MLTDEQREFRRTGIGGSDLGPIFGLTKRSALSVYLEKIGEGAPDISNDDMTFGSEAESFILRMYAKKFGYQLVDRPADALPIRSKKYPFMLASLDGMTKNGFVVEIKNVGQHGNRGPFNGRAWGEPSTCQIPFPYHLQVAHYCLITEAPTAHIVPYFGGSDLRLYIYHRNERLENVILSKCKNFWNEHVVKRIPPLDGADHREMTALWKELDEESCSVATQDITKAVRELREIRAKKKELEDKEDALKSKVCAYMADKALLNTLEGISLASWREDERRQIDVTRLRKEDPELAEKFTVTKKTRTLRLLGGQND